MACPYCYARRMYDRFGWDKTIRYEDVFWYPGIKGKPGDKYFVGSMMELFGDWIEKWWLENIFEWVTSYPQRTFIFLTKQPQNLQKWSPFPSNTWIGATATNLQSYAFAVLWLQLIEAPVRFISVEPLLAEIPTEKTRQFSWHPDWLIIGAETGNRKEKPPLEQVQDWAREIIKAADEAGIPVFTKDNLKLPANEVRREWPKP